ncbi:hypothetical protein LXL04_029965 [Taraxacum kok-saghyz]
MSGLISSRHCSVIHSARSRFHAQRQKSPAQLQSVEFLHDSSTFEHIDSVVGWFVVTNARTRVSVIHPHCEGRATVKMASSSEILESNLATAENQEEKVDSKAELDDNGSLRSDSDCPTGEFEFKKAGAWKSFVVNLRLLTASSWQRVRKGSVLNIKLRGKSRFSSGLSLPQICENKVGVEPQVERIGKYKSMGDRITRKNISKENREALTTLVDNVYENSVNTVANTELASLLQEPGARRGSFFEPKSGIVAEKFIEKIRKVREWKRYKAVIIRIDSPGGDALASDLDLWLIMKKSPFLHPIHQEDADLSKELEEAPRSIANRMSNRNENDFILVPYNPSMKCYYLDSLKHSTINQQLKQIIDAAMLVYTTQSGSDKRINLMWEQVQVPKQPGNKECGYYGCKFMKEIIDNGLDVLVNVNIGDGKQVYRDIDLDGIREDWVHYVSNFVLKKKHSDIEG